MNTEVNIFFPLDRNGKSGKAEKKSSRAHLKSSWSLHIGSFWKIHFINPPQQDHSISFARFKPKKAIFVTVRLYYLFLY